jgi:excisionase family DNA binding protein
MCIQNLLTKREVAELFRVSLRTVSNWMRCGIVPFIRIGSVVRFDRDAVRKAVEAYHVKSCQS